MSINVYTCTQADLETLEGIGPKSAADIIAMRNEDLAGSRPKITINHLVGIRLQYENWQGFINDGKFSITFHAEKDEGEPQMVKTNLTNKAPLTTEHEQTVTGQNVTGDELAFTVHPLTGQTMTMTEAQDLLGHNPHDISTESSVHEEADTSLQDSVVMLAQQVDAMANQINGLGTTISQKLTSLSDNVSKLQQQNTNMQMQLHHQDKESTEIQKKLAVHDTFMADISKWLPPPVPVSSKLPIFKKSALNQPQLNTTQVNVKTQLQSPATTPVSGKLQADLFTASPQEKPVITQPISLTLPPLASTQYPWQAQSIPTNIPPDVKPKHPQQVYDLLKDMDMFDHPIHRHCFVGGYEEYKQWSTDLPNCYFSISPVTVKDPRSMFALSSFDGRKRLLLETDASYLAQYPWNVSNVVEEAAQSLDMTLTELVRVCNRNAARLYSLPW